MQPEKSKPGFMCECVKKMYFFQSEGVVRKDLVTSLCYSEKVETFSGMAFRDFGHHRNVLRQ